MKGSMNSNYIDRPQSNSKKEQKTFVDYDIFKGKIRLVQNGSQPKIIERDDAIELAHSQDMNLVQIAYNKNDYPHIVCKIMDYNKYRYEQKQKEKAAKKAARAAKGEVKEICFTIRIEDGDKQTKIEHIRKFLSEKNTKVKITIKLSRREQATLVGMAKDLMKEILSNFDGTAALDGNPSYANGIMSCIIKAVR